MIWFLYILLLVFALLVLFAPRGSKHEKNQRQTEIDAYGAEISRLEAVTPTSDTDYSENILHLKRQILKLSGKDEKTGKYSAATIGLLSLFFITASFGLYFQLGNPNFVPQPAQEQVSASPETLPEDMSLTQLQTEYERLLAGEKKNDPNGWRLYGRILMTSAKYSEAFRAYEKALSLSGNDAAISEEYEKAKAFAVQQTGQQQSGPSQQQVSAASNMSGPERKQMILSMVEGLAEKLKDNPDDPQGWARLLQSRGVLGQTDKAQEDISRLQEIYKDDPGTLSEILISSGWAARPEK